MISEEIYDARYSGNHTCGGAVMYDIIYDDDLYPYDGIVYGDEHIQNHDGGRCCHISFYGGDHAYVRMNHDILPSVYTRSPLSLQPAYLPGQCEHRESLCLFFYKNSLQRFLQRRSTV